MPRASHRLDQDAAHSTILEEPLEAATQPVVRHVAITLAKLEGTSWAQADRHVRAEVMKTARALLQEERAFLSAFEDTAGTEETDRFESSIWFRALHKSASMFIYKFCSFVARKLPRRWELYSANNRPPNLDDAAEATDSFIGLDRSFRALREDYLARRPRTIFQLRDPRDILVSEYFSLGFIHSDQKFSDAAREMREKIQSGAFTIDDYALLSARQDASFFGGSGLCERMNENLAAAIAQCDCAGLPYLVVRYEDMVLDFPRWATSVLDFMQLSSLRDPAIEHFRHEFDVKTVEDRREVMEHKRVIIPGDYRAKLKPETIEELNRLFDPILSTYYQD